MIKAVFVDVDDTLLNSQRKITEHTKNIVKKCIENDIKIILTSGRSRLDTLNYQMEAGASPYIISSNGADIYDIEKSKKIYSNSIPKEILKKLLEYAEQQGHKIMFNYDFELVMNMCFFPDEKNKQRTIEQLNSIIENKEIVQCVISDRDFSNIKKFREYLNSEIPELKIENESKRFKNPELKPSSNYYCDMTSKGVSKGKAVKVLCEYLNISINDIVVIGDGENDISMFEETINSVAMENAVEEVKKRAKYITSSNDEDGVAKFLEKLLKQEQKWHD